jgi:hypothetical protein
MNEMSGTQAIAKIIAMLPHRSRPKVLASSKSLRIDPCQVGVDRTCQGRRLKKAL